MLADDTIAAISSPPGEGAIAVIRVSGPQAWGIARGLFSNKAAELKPRVLHFGEFRDERGKLDEGLLALFRRPRSYSGEDMAEIHCHGGILVTSRLFEAILRAGARAAEPGEFTRRAFVNGKMDLTQAEAVMDVIRASTPRALRAAEEQLEGRLGEQVERTRAELLAIVAHLEAYIDFPEEGIDPHAGARLLADLAKVQEQLDALLATADEGRILREGVQLVLCGAPNAGKSSLLNRLLGVNRAIVSAIPGTTRDTIEEFANLHGIPFRITDTAGLRETTDVVEREGVERAERAIAKADVVLHVVDGTTHEGEEALEGEILVINKVDLLSAPPEKGIAISCLTGAGLEELVDAIVKKVIGSHVSESETRAVINARHRACLEKAKTELEQAAADLRAGADPELVAVPLRAALDAVGAVIGAADIEEILGEIFSTFCIGK